MFLHVYEYLLSDTKINLEKSARNEVEASHHNKIDYNLNVNNSNLQPRCHFYFFYVLPTDFYHSWNRKYCSKQPRIMGSSDKIMQGFV